MAILKIRKKHIYQYLRESATSMFHFMNETSAGNPFVGVYDDIDGYTPATAFGPGGYIGGQIFKHLALDSLFNLKVSYPESRRVLENYQMKDADDQLRDSYSRELIRLAHWIIPFRRLITSLTTGGINGFSVD